MLARLIQASSILGKYTKPTSIILSAALIAACGGGEVGSSSSVSSTVLGSSSSSADVNSSPTQSSSTPLSSSSSFESSSNVKNSSSVKSSSSVSRDASSEASESSISSVIPPSSANSSSQASSIMAPAIFDDFVSDSTNGKILYEAQCQLCHGPDGNSGQAIDLGRYPTSAVLFDYIVEFMPKQGPNTSGPGDCLDQCAADVTAYMDTWRKAETAACSDDNPVLYGERALKLLTAAEYRNSVQDLFPNAEVPAEFLTSLPDIKIGKFPNHLDTAMISGRARQFMSNAEKIADWAIANDQLANCANAQACADSFVTGFAYRAFRRPLTTSGANNEAAQFADLFNKAPNTNAGKRWAIITALTSPNFLYRSELGVPLSEAITAGWNQAPAGAQNSGDYQAQGDGVTVNGANFQSKGSGEVSAGFGYNMYTNGTSSQSFEFAQSALLSITVKANDLDNQWPEMEVSVGNTVIATESVNGYNPQTFTYFVSGQAGNQTIAIKFANDNGRQPYGTPGNDIDLHIGDVNVTTAVRKPSTEPEPQSPFELADTNSYVLTPFEYAATLSYMFTGSTPDSQLLAAAASGQINSPAVVQSHIERMLNSSAAENHIKAFAETWMRIDHMFEPGFTRNGNGFDDSIRQAMIDELRETFWYIFDQEDVPFSEFFTGDYIFANKVLADFYGIAHTGSPNSFEKLNTTTRGGITTMGAFMANWAHQNESAPILRAVNVRELLLCHHIDPPPQTNIAERKQLQEEVDALLVNGEMSTRLYYGKITTHPQCDSCHKEDINPLGFGMEDFDQVGLPRTTQLDKGGNNRVLAINDQGALFGTEVYKDHADAAEFKGAKALSKILGNTDAVQACLVEKFIRQVVSRPVKNSARDQLVSERTLTDEQAKNYSCAQDQLTQVLKNNGENPKAAYKALGTLELIRFRR